MKKILIMCTYNSVRSQMGEGFLRHMAPRWCEVCSAGVVATGVRPAAAYVMREIGIDISAHRSRSLEVFRDRQFDYVITLSEESRCAVKTLFGDAVKLHWEQRDPGTVDSSEEERLTAFRAARDEIKEKIMIFLQQYSRS